MHSFLNQLSDHRDETGSDSNGRDSDEVNAAFLAKLARFSIEIEKNLDMIGQEANRLNDHVLDAIRLVKLFDAIDHISSSHGCWGGPERL